MATPNDYRKVDAIAEIAILRDQIARFIAEHAEDPQHLIEHCDNNSWNDCVAYDFREALFKLGSVIATLYLWEKELKLPDEVLEAAARLRKEREGK